jgi:hypothetical protein
MNVYRRARKGTEIYWGGGDEVGRFDEGKN